MPLVLVVFSIIGILLVQCSDDHPTGQIHTIGRYTLKGPVLKPSCNANDPDSRTLECLSMTYGEAEEIAKQQPGWDIPDIKDWENIIAIVLDKDTTEVRDQSFFTGASPAFTKAIKYENQFKTYNIWVKGKLTSKSGFQLRRSLKIQSGGGNQKNLIIMGNPIEMDGKVFDPEAVVYFLKME